MEVLVGGSSLGIEVSSASAFVRDRAAAAAAQAQAGDDSDAGFGAGRSGKSEEDSSSEKSSSIGAPDDSDEEEEEDEDGAVVSSEDAKGGFRKGGGFGSFGSLASLEDSLPIKRGLSNHFSGKSKSFSNLSEANLTEAVGSSSARDLEKPEHPFNKKRRILRWSKNFSLLSTAKSMPLFPLSEEHDDDVYDADADAPDHRGGGDDDADGGGRGKTAAAAAAAAGSRFSGGRHGRKHSVFKSSSCFALSDLHEEDEEEAAAAADDDDEEDEQGGGN